jgi:hypothetical protein
MSPAREPEVTLEPDRDPKIPARLRVTVEAGRWRFTFGVRANAVPPTAKEARAISDAIASELMRVLGAPPDDGR